MANFYEVRTADMQSSIYVNVENLQEFMAYDNYIDYKGVQVSRSDFLEALMASGSTVNSIVREGVAVEETENTEASEAESA